MNTQEFYELFKKNSHLRRISEFGPSERSSFVASFSTHIKREDEQRLLRDEDVFTVTFLVRENRLALKLEMSDYNAMVQDDELASTIEPLQFMGTLSEAYFNHPLINGRECFLYDLMRNRNILDDAQGTESNNPWLQERYAYFVVKTLGIFFQEQFGMYSSLLIASDEFKVQALAKVYESFKIHFGYDEELNIQETAGESIDP